MLKIKGVNLHDNFSLCYNIWKKLISSSHKDDFSVYIVLKAKKWIKSFFSFNSNISKKCIFLEVAPLCYQSSVTANRVVLDGFLTYQSSTTACNCTLTSSKSTTVRFKPLNSLHPINSNCGSNIRVQTGGNSFMISCFVSGTAPISPSQSVTLNFEKPPYAYDSNYCILLDKGKQLEIKTNINNEWYIFKLDFTSVFKYSFCNNV